MFKKAKLEVILNLTRWKEHLPFVIPLSILGGMLASEMGKQLNFAFVLVTLANILAVSFAFMINEIEDAEDDANDPKRRLKNPIASKQIQQREAYKISAAVATLALFLYLSGGVWAFLVGIVTLLFSFLYSWRTVRLKAWPIIDVVSHALMLSGLLALATFVTFSTELGAVWSVLLFVTLFSAYGQLYNQLRDFESDTKAGLRNTSILVGKKNIKLLMYLVLTLAVVCFGFSIYQRIFPAWLIVPVLFALPIGLATRSKHDIRGNEVADVTATTHTGVLIILNIVAFCWLLSVVI